jgi:hypothetical protein
MEVLNGHTSPETAYVVSDYPYGFRLRCQIRYWIETKGPYGMRFVSQTTNPKRPGEVWNSPKLGTYSDLVVMLKDPSNGYISNDAIHSFTGPDRFVAFREHYYDQMLPEHQKRFDAMEGASRKMSPLSWFEYDRAVVGL